MRALPLISMAQEPQISSRQFESYETGVVFLPSRVTGFSAMSRRQMMTFMEGRHCRENSSQRAGSFGLAWRFTLTMTCFVSAMNPRQAKPQARWPEVQILFRGVVTARPRPDERNVDRLVGELDFVVHPFSARGLQPVGVVPAGKVRLVMSAARLVARQRAKRDHPRQDQHVLQLAGEVQRLVRPLRAVAEIDFLVALLQSADLCFGHLQVFVHACDGDVLGHDVSEFAPDRDGILRSVLTDELLILFFLALLFGIDAEKFFVDFQNAFELAVERFARNVRDVQIDSRLCIHAEFFLIHDAVNRACGDVSWNKVAVLWIPFFQKVETLRLGNAFRGTLLRGAP